MSDEKEINLNLEPIGEDDVNLAKKFGHIEKIDGNPSSVENGAKIVSVEKETPKEIISAEKDSAYGKILSAVKQNPTDLDDNIKSDAVSVSEKIDAESQIQHLVDLAVAKGVVHAVKVARHLDDNYILDMFHDKMISDELEKVLVEKNLLSK